MQEPQFDAAAYGAFIGQIRLQGIWLASARIENRAGPATPDSIMLRVDDSASWDTHEWGFRAAVAYRIRFMDGRRKLATIDATFAVDFASDMPMTDQLFTTFSDVNLPVNTWPYLREFVSSTLGRLGWTPFTLPALKRGVAPPQDSE